MKVNALFLTNEKHVEVFDIEVGAPKANQVQVETKACGVCAWDSSLFRGMNLVEPFPCGYGHEAVGYVKAVGEDVTRFKIGDKVFCIFCNGVNQMSQVFNINAERVGFLPDVDEKEFPYNVIEPVVCTVSGMDLIPARPGDKIALIGTGYMGLLNVQTYVHSSLGKLVCFDVNEERLKLAKKFGADEVYLSNSPEGKAAIDQYVAQGGFDTVIECSGSQPGLTTAVELVKVGGTVSNFAWHRGTREMDGTSLHMKGIAIINTSDERNLHFTDEIARASALAQRGVFDQHSLITHVMPYTKAQEIMMIADTKADGYIKGVITF